MAHRIYPKKRIPMHALLEVALSTLVNYTTHCRPSHSLLRETTDHTQLMTDGSLGLTIESTFSRGHLYLNAKLYAHIYLRQAEGFEERDEDGQLVRGPENQELVYELDKAIYGLVQSGLMWEEEH
ncbi:MAG: hypothetical protein SGPRY_012034, partial [Prymnesium sp.]